MMQIRAFLSLFIFISFYFTQIYSYAGEIQIMSYNVQNLFDAKVDKDLETGKDKIDWEFLPAHHPNRILGCEEKQKDYDKNCYQQKNPKKKQSCLDENERYYKICIAKDWNNEKVELKLNQIKKVVLDSRESLPDMLALQEIENEEVIRDLSSALGYKYYSVTNSPDHRGIDVALLFNESKDIKYIETTEYKLEGERFEEFPTRNLLEVSFLIGMKHKLYVYVNHWPSQAAPSEVRAQVAEQLLGHITDRYLENKDAYYLVTGDFNVIDGESPHPFRDVFQNPNKSSFGFMDIGELYNDSQEIPEEKKLLLPKGTYFYGKDAVWNKLDRFFISPNLIRKNGLGIDLKSYDIYSKDFMRDHNGKYKDAQPPQWYDHFGSSSNPGYSDHFPIYLKLKY